MYKRAHYNEIWFCDRYFIGGTDILSDGNRKFIKEININLYDYSKTFRINTLKEPSFTHCLLTARNSKLLLRK